MYERTDRVIEYLNKQLIALFYRAKLIVDFDELNVIQFSKSLYEEIDKIVKEAYLALAEATANDIMDDADEEITMIWLLERLREYDKVTKYVYENEFERKRQKFAEALISSDNKNEEIDKALRSMSKMVSQFAIEITDSALIVGYKALGVEKVMWVTERDAKVCDHCKQLDGKVFSIDDIPPKVHWNCRCYVIPV